MEEELNVTGSPDVEEGASAAEVWGYGFLFVTIINLSAFAGVWVIPLMDKRLYKHVLMFLVSLAVGTLAGTALFCLIPVAHGLEVDEMGTELIWKNLVILGGIYLFFNTERILKIIASRRREKARKKNKGRYGTQPSVQVTAMHNIDSNPDRIGYKITSPTEAMGITDARDREGFQELMDSPSDSPACDCQEDTIPSEVFLKDAENGYIGSSSTGRGGDDNDNHNYDQHGQGYKPIIHPCHCHAEIYDGRNMIATVAYMIIFGDGLHNFIDGLAIGASFSMSIYQGISTSIAVICEEIPHELGDFAILLNSGMSVRQAVLANFLSACTCYLGLIIGIILGESYHAADWIFALAGGMFLYISLVDMLPEINNVGGGDPLHEDQRSIKIFLIQNAGLLTGFGLMLVLALFEGSIKRLIA